MQRLWILPLLVVGLNLSPDMFANARPCPEKHNHQDKTFVFPRKGVEDYVVLQPAQPLHLSAFTLCLRVATELPDNLETILFSYNNGADALSVWREPNGFLSLYINHDNRFYLPVLSALKTHICVTWESSTGATTFWVDGKKSLKKNFRQGHTIQPGGVVILGQDQDVVGGSFESKQSFQGEISDVNLWNYVIADCAIREVYEERKYTGNVIDWNSTPYTIHGNVETRY